MIDRNAKDEKEAARKKAKWQRLLFPVTQANALVNVGLSTAEAIIKGFALFGPPPSPAGIAAAAAAGTTGALQAAAILSKRPPPMPAFAGGGTVGGAGGVDSQVVRATPGETMLNPGQSRNLFNALQASGLLKGAGQGITNNNTTNSESMTVSMAGANFNLPNVTDPQNFMDELYKIGKNMGLNMFRR